MTDSEECGNDKRTPTKPIHCLYIMVKVFKEYKNRIQEVNNWNYNQESIHGAIINAMILLVGQ
jgi:hypothetical protein